MFCDFVDKVKTGKVRYKKLEVVRWIKNSSTLGLLSERVLDELIYRLDSSLREYTDNCREVVEKDLTYMLERNCIKMQRKDIGWSTFKPVIYSRMLDHDIEFEDEERKHKVTFLKERGFKSIPLQIGDNEWLFLYYSSVRYDSYFEENVTHEIVIPMGSTPRISC